MMNKSADNYGKVVVLMGGISAEREISLISGKNILESLRRSGVDAHGLDVQSDVVTKLLELKPDRVFIALHGMGGEDGTIQGVLEYLNIPYTGSGVTASAITMDKPMMKLIWQSLGVPTPQFRLVTDIEAAFDVLKEWGFPLCIKPTNDGSSVGVTKITESDQLTDAFRKAAAYDNRVMIEPWIEGKEYTVGILGSATLPLIEIKTPRTFYDFDAKYNEDSTQYICPCNLPPEREQEIQDLAARAYIAAGCAGWGRVDLVEDTSGNLWFLEINTIPGMTEHSLVPKAARVLGLSFDQLVLEILSYTLVATESSEQITA